MPDISREMLVNYIEEALSTSETAQVEQALRESDALRKTLRAVIQERDRGEHTIGAIWRRERLTCPTREQLASYLLQTLEPELQQYIDFHLDVIGCPFCQANFTDLKSLQEEAPAETRKRRQKFFQSSAGYISAGKKK